MASGTNRRVSDIKSEIRSINRELSDCSSLLRNQFQGIGTDMCSDCLDDIISQLEYVITRLNNIDTSSLTQEFLEFMGLDS